MLSHGSSADESHILIWLFFNCIASRTDAGDTYKRLWKELVWSLYWLFKGRWPTHSSDGVKYTAGVAAERAGKLLAAGYYGVLWFLRFDNDAAQGTFHLADHNNDKVCFFGPAGPSGACVWTDARSPPHNSWVPSTYTNFSHETLFGNNRHCLLRVLPGFGVSHFIRDLLHCKWLGADQYYLGGVLYLIVKYLMPGTIGDNVVELFAPIKDEYDAQQIPHKDRYTSLRLSQFKTMQPIAKLPKFKGTGQQCKGLTRVIANVFRLYWNPGVHAHVRIVEGLEAMRETDRLYLLHRYANRMPQSDSDRVIAASFKFCQICTGLVRHFHGLRMPVFHYTLKHHYCLHIALSTKYLNPWHAECSSGEDYMKFAKRLVRGCMYGNRIYKVANVAVQKYIYGFTVKRCPRQRWWKNHKRIL